VVKKLLTIGLILASVWMILFFSRMMHQREVDPSIGRSECLIRDTACYAEVDSVGQISLQIEPANLPVMQSLMLTVKVPVKTVDAVSLQFVGQDMDMGLQPVTLTRNPEVSGLWQGEGAISLCTVNPDMSWLARVKVMVSGKPHIVEFLLGPATH